MTTQQPDDDLTVILPNTRAKLDASGNTPDNRHYSENVLPIGAVLGEFEIVDLIGWGGFGIVYLAYDHSLQRQVALKEYMPSSLAIRDARGFVTIRSENHKETFEAGLKSFINEAQLLAHFNHSSLLKVYQFWRSNGTAYMVMPLYQGKTLKEKMSNDNTSLDEKWLKNILFHLLDALRILHNDQCYHRDISPDNIIILADESPILLDFGAARRVISDMTQSLTVILKPGYAPIEQYGDEATLTQGPWTDIYAIAAVVYFLITGKAPTPSVSRLVNDKLPPLSKIAADKYNLDFLKAIDKALSVKPEDRPRNVEEFSKLLGIPLAQKTILHSPPSKTTNRKSSKHVAVFGAIIIAIIAIVSFKFLLNPKLEQEQDQTSDLTPTQRPNIADPIPVYTDPVHVLEEIFNSRNRDHAVTISIEKAQAVIGKGKLNFKIRSARPGYIYILAVGTNHTDFLLLFPNARDKNNHIAANQQIELPRKEWELIAGGPPGTNHFIAIVSDEPRDFSQTGLTTTGIFSAFTTELHQSYQGSTPLFAGSAICTSGTAQNCSQSYGAALFSIEEIETP